MSTTLSSEQSRRLEALKAKHYAIAERLETAMKRPGMADYYLKQLKKQKLQLKDSIQQFMESNDSVKRMEAAE
ncbi:MAG: DUF465 domain-containing protein [Alphaproteobacteria bacterium]|nr:DUF465 domain-containing protein [Alphaproteobacteria bacterium]